MLRNLSMLGASRWIVCAVAMALYAAGVEAAEQPPVAASDAPLATDAALRSIRVPDGFQVELVAAEPLVQDPVAIAWGADLKLWVVEMADYPLGLDNQGQPGGRVRFLEDVDGDGVYDKSTLFLDGINMPNGILPWRKGVLVTAAPEIFYAEDTDGDGRADLRKTLYRGFKEGNPQLRINGLRWGLDNWIYCANGWSGGEIESAATGQRAALGGRDVRIRPDDGAFDVQSGVSQFGRNPDDWGNWFGVNNSNPLWHYVLADHYLRRNPHFAAPNPINQLRVPVNPEVYAISPPQKRFHSFNQSGRFTSACQAIIYRDELVFPRGEVRHALTCEPFHNLVQHAVVSEAGVSFTAERATDAGEVEFFASNDVWCRPVMSRTGPDGAVYVVDMYRLIIEHPLFLPPEGQKELAAQWRMGEDRGRIYRVTAKNAPRRAAKRLDKLSAAELVAALDSPNGWRRDTAQQLLIWRGETSVAPALVALYENSPNPLARLHALCTLDGLNQLDAELLIAACGDAHPGVRREAVRLSESRVESSPPLFAALEKLATDADAKVRLQLACSLGEISGERSGRPLAEILAHSPQDAYLTAAVMSSIRKENVVAALTALREKRAGNAALGGSYAQLIGLAAALGRNDAVLSAVTAEFDGQASASREPPFEPLAELLAVLAGRGDPWKQLGGSQDAKVADALAKLKQLVASGRQVALDVEEPLARRVAAVRVLGYEAEFLAEDEGLLAELLSPQSPLELQLAAVAQLARQSAASSADRLLESWRSQAPRVRAAALEALLSRPAWAERLLAHVETGSVLPADLDAAARQRLLTHSNAALKERATKLLAASNNADRQAVLAEYQTALELAGDKPRGEKIFQQKCAACHKLGETGHEVGPSLASLTDKSPASLLIAILDPSRAVETRFQNYLAITTAGQTHSGVLATETSTSVTLLGQEGKQLSLLRGELEALQSTGKSLMPDGLEKDLSPQDVADLIALLGGL